MFDAWTKPKFYTKCKSALRHLRTRLDHVKKKRIAVEKFLKTDIAELLNAGLDYNAYLKADMLLIEQNVTACYDLVEYFCGCISDHLSNMVKERECPEDCREAAASLIYAAARFADLPELRQLRTLFTGKYGNSIESFANKEFVGKFKTNPPSKDTKLRLMQDIAQEFSVDWNSKALEQRLFTPPPPQQDEPKHSSPQHTDPEQDAPASNEVMEKNEVTAEPRRGGGTEHDNQRQVSSTSTGSFTSDDAESNRPFYYRFIRPPYNRPRVSNTTSDEIEKNQSSDEPKLKTKARSFRWRSSNEEERVLDRLLRYYSKKKSNKEEGNAKEVAAAEAEAEEVVEEPWKGHRATKSMSAAEGESSGAREGKTHGRASSLDLGGHVHPNMPNYDQLAARIAALRGL